MLCVEWPVLLVRLYFIFCVISCQINCHSSLQSIYISRVTENGAAHKDGKIVVGDRLISVRMSVLYCVFVRTCFAEQKSVQRRKTVKKIKC